MKTKMLIVGIIAMFVFAASAFAQDQASSNVTTVKIQTSAQCGMCKDRIEGALAYEKGVSKSELNLTDKVVTVTFDAKKTNPDKIRQLLSKTGYDADGVAADPTAYAKLPACCKKKASTSGCQPGCKSKCTPGCKH